MDCRGTSSSSEELARLYKREDRYRINPQNIGNVSSYFCKRISKCGCIGLLSWYPSWPCIVMYASFFLTIRIVWLNIWFRNNKAGTVFCYQRGPIYSCASANCSQVGAVSYGQQYPSDCYVIEQMDSDGAYRNQWCRITVQNGKQGYANCLHCAGDLPRCWYRRRPLVTWFYFLHECVLTIWLLIISYKMLSLDFSDTATASCCNSCFVKHNLYVTLETAWFRQILHRSWSDRDVSVPVDAEICFKGVPKLEICRCPEEVPKKHSPYI
jgi:hypothetical protein